MIRSFDWRDFPALHRHRNDGICLDTILALTGRITLVPTGALLATIAPATGIHTYVIRKNSGESQRIIGQFIQSPDQTYAKISFITPESEIESTAALHLLDGLAVRAGEHGILNLLAEADDQSAAYDVLRNAGYAIYTRQRVWKLSENESIKITGDQRPWRAATQKDELEVQHLYNELVPKLVRQIEPTPWEDLNGLIYEKDGSALAYVHIRYGGKGILTQAFVHPDTENAAGLLQMIAPAIPNKRSRPVYLRVRSHHAWLGSFLDDLNYPSLPHQAVMVKRLAKRIKENIFRTLPKSLENAQPNVSTSLTPIQPKTGTNGKLQKS